MSLKGPHEVIILSFILQINYNHFTGKFRLCQQFFNGQACKIGEPFCTFAHSEAEAELWLLELNGMLDLTAFVHDQCRFRLQSMFFPFPVQLEMQY